MPFEKVARVDQVPPGKTHFLCIREAPLILANHQGEIYALYGLCPHRNNPLEGATLWDHLLDCPFHHFMYDVRTGENYFPKNVYPPDYARLQSQLRPLRTYAVEVREGDIWVNLE